MARFFKWREASPPSKPAPHRMTVGAVVEARDPNAVPAWQVVRMHALTIAAQINKGDIEDFWSISEQVHNWIVDP